MKILIDGDACCVISSTEYVARQHNVPCHIYCDIKHLLESEYSEIHYVERRQDSADFAIANACERGDIVITNDSGLAALVLAKQAYALNSYGVEYTKKNIMSFLNKRYVRKTEQKKTNRTQVHGQLYRSDRPSVKCQYSAVLSGIINKSERKCAEIRI